MGSFGLLGEYTEVSQDVSRVVDDGHPHGHRGHGRLAGRGLVLPDRRGGVVPRLPAEVAVLAGGQAPGAPSRWSRACSRSRSGDEAFAGGADSFADPLASASQADSWGIGFNWYLNENVKWLLDYERTSFEGGAADGGDRPDEDAYQLRLAVGF